MINAGWNIKPPGRLLPGGFCSPSQCVKKQKGETWYQSHLADQQLHQLLEKVDADLAQEACQQGCLYCGESCIGPIMIANLVAARNGTGAIVFVVPKKIAGDGERRSRCVSWGEGFMRAWWSCWSRR